MSAGLLVIFVLLLIVGGIVFISLSSSPTGSETGTGTGGGAQVGDESGIGGGLHKISIIETGSEPQVEYGNGETPTSNGGNDPNGIKVNIGIGTPVSNGGNEIDPINGGDDPNGIKVNTGVGTPVSNGSNEIDPINGEVPILLPSKPHALDSFIEHNNLACSNPNNPGNWPANWSSNARSAEDCAQQCLSSLTCVGFEYDESGGKCNVSSSCTSDVAIDAPNYTVYDKQDIDLNQFTGLHAMACAGRNELGSTINYTNTLSECASKCLDDDTCTSFEYTDSGTCAMSTSCIGDISTSYPTDNLYTKIGVPLDHFIPYVDKACAGRNELSTLTKTTTSACAAECVDDSTCVSFEIKDSTCHLSTTCTPDIATKDSGYILYGKQ